MTTRPLSFRMPRSAAWTVGVLAAVIVVLGLVVALFDWNRARGPIARQASAISGRLVRIDGDLKVHLLSWTPSASAEHLWIANPAWLAGGRLAQVDRLTVQVRLLPLLLGRVELPLVELDKPDVSLFRDASDRANWRRDARPAAPLNLPPIQHFVIRDGHVGLVDQKRHLVLSGTVESRETDVRPGHSGGGQFQLQGAGTLNKDPFLLHIVGGPLLNVRRDQPYRFDADLLAGRTHVVAHGALPRPFDFGQVDSRLTVSGADFADLYYLTGLALPSTPSYALAGRLVRDGRRYRFTGVSGRVGGSDLDGAFLVDDTTGRPDLHANLHSHRLNYRDLGSLVGAPPRGVQRTPLQQAQAARLTAESRFLPDATLNIGRIRAMDATVKYRADTVAAPNNLPLRKVALDLSLDKGVLKFDPISFIMPHGELTGRVRLDARGTVPLTEVDLKVLNIRLEDLFRHTGDAPLEGNFEARAVLHGYGDSVHKAASTADGTLSLVAPRGKIRQAFAELLGINVANGVGLLFTNDHRETGLRCAVADFQAVHGVLRARTLVVDTDVVQSVGQGTINLGTEALDLTLLGKPKELRLFHLAAPVSVTGHLNSPRFGVKAGAAPLQVAGSVALGAVLGPIAAILPFIDPGLANDADCVGLVGEAQKKGAPVKTSATTSLPSKKR
jgi:uncharacterized protein involved in outer membrane biogenesis